jgi:hypothetical protein
MMSMDWFHKPSEFMGSVGLDLFGGRFAITDKLSSALICALIRIARSLAFAASFPHDSYTAILQALESSMKLEVVLDSRNGVDSLPQNFAEVIKVHD